MKKAVMLVVILLVVPLAALAGETEEANKALARRFYEQIWFSHNPSAVDQLVAPTYVIHDIRGLDNVSEPAQMQKDIPEFFWERGKMTGRIDYQIAEGDLVATRWQWEFEPDVWWMKALAGKQSIPIINVFRVKDGKIVEIWNHRHDIDTFQGKMPLYIGLAIGILPSLVLLVILIFLFRKNRRLRRSTGVRQ
ncbi:MAG: nuclear transport factor 2 family protein [Pyrinomonadaceae bacterium]